MTEPKVLTLDIETSPLKVYTWGLFDQNIGINQIIEPTRIICWAAKWYGKPKVMFASEFHDGRLTMLKQMFNLLDEANAVIHFNGVTFDMKHLNREFIEEALGIYSPVQEIDLLRVVRSKFRFPSNKLDYVTKALGLSGKLSHTGFDLWRDCLDGDEKAWALMRRYNKQDVVVTEELYDVLRPYVKAHPHMGLFSGHGDVCQNCGSADLERRGFARTTISTFQRYQCRQCGAWSRAGKAIERVDIRGTA